MIRPSERESRRIGDSRAFGIDRPPRPRDFTREFASERCLDGDATTPRVGLMRFWNVVMRDNRR
jgi:hypothetical protein